MYQVIRIRFNNLAIVKRKRKREIRKLVFNKLVVLFNKIKLKYEKINIIN